MKKPKMSFLYQILASGLFVLLIAACSTRPQSPAQDVFLAESDFAAAVRIELAYDNLPRCTTPKTVGLCSDVTVIRKLRKSDDVAWVAIQQAEAAVRTPGFSDSNITAAVASAKALTNAFVSITDTLKTK